jgi:GrpB-like predicted nucleotidyltransferase (UPF0157 family)
MAIIWPGFVRTEGSERQDLSVEVVAYDRSWPGRYERWRDLLDGQLTDTALRMEHVGSTAVPGPPAKPTIDIQISVADLDDESWYVAQIEQAGVQLRSRDALHRFFRPFAGQPRDVHVHVCQAGSDWEREHLLFRDYLRSHAGARDAYARVKWEAAQDVTRHRSMPGGLQRIQPAAVRPARRRRFAAGSCPLPHPDGWPLDAPARTAVPARRQGRSDAIVTGVHEHEALVHWLASGESGACARSQRTRSARTHPAPRLPPSRPRPPPCRRHRPLAVRGRWRPTRRSPSSSSRSGGRSPAK